MWDKGRLSRLGGLNGRPQLMILSLLSKEIREHSRDWIPNQHGSESSSRPPIKPKIDSKLSKEDFEMRITRSSRSSRPTEKDYIPEQKRNQEILLGFDYKLGKRTNDIEHQDFNIQNLDRFKSLKTHRLESDWFFDKVKKEELHPSEDKTVNYPQNETLYQDDFKKNLHMSQQLIIRDQEVISELFTRIEMKQTEIDDLKEQLNNAKEEKLAREKHIVTLSEVKTK